MLGLIARLFHRRDDESLFGAPSESPAETVSAGEVSVRRWDAADTHRLNAAQFENVTGRTINEDLVSSLPVLMARCAYEASTNPTIEGMIDTHAIDIVGPDGPAWQVLAREPARLLHSRRLQNQFKEYALAAEEVLQDWFKLPDLNGELSGVEILTMDCNQQWTAGNSIVQVVDDESIRQRNTVRLRWHPIHAERVFTNRLYGTANGVSVTLGIERTKSGKKKRYHVLEADEFGSFSGSSRFEAIPAEFIIHRFRSREPGQICGVPMLASALPTIADIRQFDKLTMEAAKLGATFGIVFEDKFPDAPQKGGARKAGGVWSSVKAGMAQILTAPKGKAAVQVDPKHPGNNYVEFRNERFRDVGRATQMPLMIVRLGAEDHSYSSARFDAQIYQRGIRRDQSSILRKYSPSLNDVLREAELAGMIPMRPLQIEIGAIFTRLPHVDPAKEAKAREMDLNTMSASLIDIWAEDGMRPQEMVTKLKLTVSSLNEVKDGFGDAWLLNTMQKTNPAVLDMYDAKQDAMATSSELAV